jgi:flotillin
MILIGILAVMGLVFVSRYKKCPPNRVLVISGRTGEEVAKCVHGGAAFVWPVLQEFNWLELEPFAVPIDLHNALSQENIRVSVPTTVTAAIGTEPTIMKNAAKSFLGRSMDEIKKQAQDIILGQMRAVIATMKIDDINRDRQAFLDGVEKAVARELEKVGLRVINVNIKDIEDDSGYIQALGKKAAAEAINQASIDVAEQQKIGQIGVAERDRDQRKAVAAAKSQADAGEAEAERDRRKAIAAAHSVASISEAESDRDRRQKISLLDAQAVETETNAASQKAAFLANQKVAEEEARAKSQSASERADGSVRIAREDSQRAAEESRGKREQARLYAEVVVPADAAKQKAIVEAEAEKQRRILVAQAAAEAELLRMQAEATGAQAILNGKAHGYKALFEACGNEASFTAALLLIEKLENVANLQTQAIKNLPIEKITVWSGGNGAGGSGLNDLGRQIMGILPPMHELAKSVGLELPTYLGSAMSSPKAAESAPPAPQPSPTDRVKAGTITKS